MFFVFYLFDSLRSANEWVSLLLGPPLSTVKDATWRPRFD